MLDYSFVHIASLCLPISFSSTTLAVYPQGETKIAWSELFLLRVNRPFWNRQIAGKTIQDLAALQPVLLLLVTQAIQTMRDHIDHKQQHRDSSNYSPVIDTVISCMNALEVWRHGIIR